MKLKYDRQLVIDYINGNDILEYDIDLLENDSEFMKLVIDKTNDKRMYNFCGDKVKSDLEFVKWLIDKFSSDIAFIKDIANEYLENNQLEAVSEENKSEYYDCIEICVIMGNIIGYTREPELIIFSAKKKSFYIEVRTWVGAIIEQSRKESNGENWGLGFYLVMDEFGDREILLKSLAEDYIMEIFKMDRIDGFEKLILGDAKSYDDIKKMGINNYLLGFIRRYDSNLAEYATIHLDVLDKVRDRLYKLGSNWKETLLQEKNKKDRENVIGAEAFIQGINNYYIDNEGNRPSFCESDLIEHIIRKFNMKDFFSEYAGWEYIYPVDLLSSDDSSKIKPVIDESDLTLADLRAIKYAVRLANNLFRGVEDEELDNYLISPSNATSEILPFKKKN